MEEEFDMDKELETLNKPEQEEQKRRGRPKKIQEIKEDQEIIEKEIEEEIPEEIGTKVGKEKVEPIYIRVPTAVSIETMVNMIYEEIQGLKQLLLEIKERK